MMYTNIHNDVSVLLLMRLCLCVETWVNDKCQDNVITTLFQRFHDVIRQSSYMLQCCQSYIIQ